MPHHEEAVHPKTLLLKARLAVKQLQNENLISQSTSDTLLHDLWLAYNEVNESILQAYSNERPTGT